MNEQKMNSIRALTEELNNEMKKDLFGKPIRFTVDYDKDADDVAIVAVGDDEVKLQIDKSGLFGFAISSSYVRNFSFDALVRIASLVELCKEWQE